jgi:murein DD-endopeptidase MepM/ murein hydrolase activator NlpD
MTDMKIKLADFIPPEKPLEKKEKELKKACQDFEAIFTYQLLKSMRNTIEKCDLFHGGQGEEIYESLLDQELSKKMAGSGENSLAESLYRQLSKILHEKSGNDMSATGNYTENDAPSWPIKNKISSGFGWRKDPFTGEDRFHYGIDIAAQEGTDVKAAMSGKVLVSDEQDGYGKTVMLDHGHGFVTIYAHNRNNTVKTGDWVENGEIIAEVGTSGRSTGPHLHFEVRRHGKQLDPLKFLGA